MSKSITIPSEWGNRVIVEINGTKYTYQAGATETVPDEVASVIENAVAMEPVNNRTSAGDAEAALQESVEALNTRLTALDDETDGAVPALDARLTALDDETDGAVPALDARVTALEEAGGSTGG